MLILSRVMKIGSKIYSTNLSNIIQSIKIIPHVNGLLLFTVDGKLLK